MTRLHAFLELLEAHGGGPVAATELAQAFGFDGAEVRSALRAHGVVRDAPRAETVACDGLGCARQVRELRRGAGDGGARRFVGVCTRDPAECEDLELSALDVAQEHVARDAFVDVVQRALRLVPAQESAASPLGTVVVTLGREHSDGEIRDVFLAWRRDARDIQAAVADRDDGARPARVLTLTRKTAAAIRAALPPSRTRVPIDALADMLTVRDGQLAELPRLAVVAPAPPPATSARVPAPILLPKGTRSPALEGLREITRWNEITLIDTPELDLVGVTFDTHVRRLSCVDFGLAARSDRRPTAVFELLKTICRGDGVFATRAFGSATNGKRLMSELRTAMRATFGLEGDPFEPYSHGLHMWKPKFRALSCSPREAREGDGPL